MQASLQKWGNLTTRQLIAAENVLKSQPQIKIDATQMSEHLKPIMEYEGPNAFVSDIKKKLIQYGTLTQKQVDAALNTIEKEKNKQNTFQLGIPTPGETVKIGRKKGQELKEKYGLKFNPILIDITEIKAMSPKAVHFAGKMTIKRGNVCMCCAKTLTDEFSMLTRMGKMCANHLDVPYITDKSQAEQFRSEYLKKVDEIGVMEFWIPKSQIRRWEGKTEVLLKMIN
jgi:hypothetical protein